MGQGRAVRKAWGRQGRTVIKGIGAAYISVWVGGSKYGMEAITATYMYVNEVKRAGSSYKSVGVLKKGGILCREG